MLLEEFYREGSEHKNPWVITLAVNGKPLKSRAIQGQIWVWFHIRCSKVYWVPVLSQQSLVAQATRYVLPVKGQFIATLRCGDRECRGSVFSAKAQFCLVWTPCCWVPWPVSRVNAVESKKMLRDFQNYLMENLKESLRFSSGRMPNPVHSLTFDGLPFQCCPRSRMHGKDGIYESVKEPTGVWVWWCFQRHYFHVVHVQYT